MKTPQLLAVFSAALKLGLTSFGGPIAHLGYFERSYVRDLRWLTHAELTELIALCQVLPGPTSSQVGFLIGQRRAGLAGAWLAWAGFTLPSALLMFGYALWAPAAASTALAPLLQGLKWVAVMVVTQAVWQMAWRLCTTWLRGGIAAVAALALLLWPAASMPALTLIAGAVVGACLLRDATDPAPEAARNDEERASRRGPIACGLFALLLLLSCTAARPQALATLAALLYRAGSAVFGGGHVVLPLLHEALVPAGWLGEDQFLSGYGAAQALPGPLFAFAAYIGAAAVPGGATAPTIAAAWAVVALLSLFLPGLLLALSATWLWQRLRGHRLARAALAGVNAAVVGVLAAALIRPVAASAVHGIADACFCILGVLALQRWRLAPIIVVAASVAASFALAGRL